MPTLKDVCSHSLLALALAAGLATPALAGPVDDPDAVLAAEGLEFELPELWVGDDAPEMTATHWIKGQQVPSFETGRAYVVEFWATWCGPCIRGFPHLSELQEHHADDVTIIGVNIWDAGRNGSEALPARVTRVKGFVDGRSDMGYTVAIDGNMTMEKDWMEAAGRTGIPSAFIVNGEGRIAWIGHPMQMDEALEGVIAGDWDVDEAAENAAVEIRAEKWMEHLGGLFQQEKWDHAYQVAWALLERDFADSSEILNQISWAICTSDFIQEKDFEFAVAAAERACEITEWENADILDTLGYAYFKAGNVAKAIETAQLAVEHADNDDQRKQFEERLDEYRQARNSR